MNKLHQFHEHLTEKVLINYRKLKRTFTALKTLKLFTRTVNSDKKFLRNFFFTRNLFVYISIALSIVLSIRNVIKNTTEFSDVITFLMKVENILGSFESASGERLTIEKGNILGPRRFLLIVRGKTNLRSLRKCLMKSFVIHNDFYAVPIAIYQALV